MKFANFSYLKFSMVKLLYLAIFFIVLFGRSSRDVEWSEYLGGADRNHYSSLDQINKENVHRLKKIWEFHTADTSGQMQCNPIMADGLLYGTTASIEVFALDPSTGKEVWRFQDASNRKWYSTNRGVSFWKKGRDARILFTAESWLYALDAKTGKRIQSFGDSGRVSLKAGLGELSKNKFVISSTPGAIYGNTIIMPLRLSESAGAAPGYIQAFDVVTGKLTWVFKTIPHPGEKGYDTWEPENYRNEYVGGANSWSGISIDQQRGIAYVPTGSAAFDFYGGNRKGNNLFANSLLALQATTGKLLWHFQFTHHDVWDRDLPAPPNLITVTRNGKQIDAVAQVTKQGFVYVFDRETGAPLFDINEVEVPTNGLKGEVLSTTQPVPVLPAPFARQSITENEINPWSPNRDELIQKFKTIRKEFYAPPSLEGTLIFPGFDGGAEWGGAAFDKESGLLFVNSNEMPWILTMKNINNTKSISSGAYGKYCTSCHGAQMQGNPSSGFPALVDVVKNKSRAMVEQVIRGGKGMMPGFPGLSQKEIADVLDYMEGKKIATSNEDEDEDDSSLPYGFTGYNKWLDKSGYPAIAPPWGTLTAIDMNSGAHRWKVPLGEYKELTAKGIPPTGSENYGGAVVTKGGLLFIAATRDEKVRAFDKETGKLLWQSDLPASAHATPTTYRYRGKQYFVLACGGGKLGTKKGDSYVAFGLEE